MSRTLRFGIVGLGAIAQIHLKSFAACRNVELVAGCDIDASRLDRLPANAKRFTDYSEMIRHGGIEAVLIAVPHYDHVPMSIEAMNAGIHVLCEKPIAVSISAARQVNEVAAAHRQVKFGIMFQRRLNPVFAKMRQLVRDGELGAISRVSWVSTDWFRTTHYYKSGGWRATWNGEGGGLLINQCPHDLDLLQWITGMMPSRITAVGFIGKTHPIEVEDEVSAILEYPNGAIGHFHATTGETPGTNRLEIVGERGRLVMDAYHLRFSRTTKNASQLRDAMELFPSIETWEIDLLAGQALDDRQGLMQNFIDHVLGDVPLVASGIEGVHGLEIGNAMALAALTRQPVDLPLDAQAYDRFLIKMKQNSTSNAMASA